MSGFVKLKLKGISETILMIAIGEKEKRKK